MFDIAWAIAVLLLTSALGLHIGSRFGRKVWSANLTCVIVVVATLTFVRCVHGQLWLAKCLPVSNVIVLSNLMPVAAAVLSGVLRAHPGIVLWRRQSLALILLVSGWLTVAWVVFPQRFNSRNVYHNGVCLQSTPVTCSACSAVTLLGQAGIETNEKEMTRLCLTSGRGTHLLGIFRGLQLKTKGTPYQVQVVDCEFDELQDRGDFPILAAVRQETSTDTFSSSPIGGIDNLLPRLMGNSEHCIVLFEITDRGTVVVGDPALLTNPAEVPIESLRKVWLRQGFRLIKNGESSKTTNQVETDGWL